MLAQPYNRRAVTRVVRLIVIASVVAAIAVFLVVQDRLTAAGAREYVTRQRAAAAGQADAVTIDEVMRPAVARSVRAGLLWGGLVLAAGLAMAFSAGRWPDVRATGRAPNRR
jgi:hypothetical protein